MRVRKFLHRRLQIRLHVKELWDTDIVLPKYRTVIQVRGCFWHSTHAQKGAYPKRGDYWSAKLSKNVEQSQNDNAIQQMGWSLIIIWECDVKSATKLNDRMEQVIKLIAKQ